jgi:hypothetical protein
MEPQEVKDSVVGVVIYRHTITRNVARTPVVELRVEPSSTARASFPSAPIWETGRHAYSIPVPGDVFSSVAHHQVLSPPITV